MLAITDILGETKILNGIQSIVRSRKVNGEKTLDLVSVPTDANQHAFDSVDVESRFSFEGEPYIIKDFSEKNHGALTIKTAHCVHTFFDDLINSHQYDVFSGSQTLAAALQRVFGPTVYNYSIVDTFKSEEFENFGDDNCLALFKTVLERYGAEFEVVNKQVYIRRSIGARTGFQLRWKHNIKAIEKTVDSKNLSTYIKGYGKPKEETDVLSGTKIPISSRSGTYYTETGQNVLATQQVNASFNFSFLGTGFDFDTIKTFIGGKWTFTIDGKTNVSITTFKEDVTAEHAVIPVVRGLEHKQHTVQAVFKGRDKDNWNTSPSGGGAAAIGYLKSGNIIHLYRELVGDERFEVWDEYTSPNAAKYPSPTSADGLRHAQPISDERITTQAAMREKLIQSLPDVPRLGLSVDIAQVDGTIHNEGDYGYIIYDPMKIKVEARAVEVTETFQFVQRKWVVRNKTVALDNLQNKITDVTTRFAQTSKQFDRLMQGKENLPYNVLPEAVRLATEAINNSMTEILYPEGQGMVLQDPRNPNILVRLTSRGIGISDDGGANYRTAMTGVGIVADEIVTGILRANNVMIQGEEDLFFWDGTGLWAYDPADMTRYVKLTSAGLHIAKGALTIERPDGYVVMNNGLLQNDFSLQPTNPEFRNKQTVSEQGVYWATTETSPQNCAAYFFAHKSRFLQVQVVLHDLGSGLGARMSVDEIGGSLLGQATRYNLTDATATPFPVIISIDLGTPTGAQRGVYIRLNTNTGGEARGRIQKIWLEQ